MRSKLWIAALLALLLAGAAPGLDEDGPVIGFLETNRYFITILAGENGSSRYTVHTREGELLARAWTEGELMAKLPKVHEALKGALAADAAVRAEF